MKILAFPASGPYPDALYDQVRARGVAVSEGPFTFSYLLKNAMAGDVVHLHWPSYLYAEGANRLRLLLSLIRFFFLLLVIKVKGARLAWTAHNLYPHERTPLTFSDPLARRWVIALADVIFVHGPAARDVLVKEFPAAHGKLTLITHGHWVDKYKGRDSRATARAALGLPDSSYVYLFFGMCRPYKNLAYLIKTFAAMPPNCRLLIAGKFQTRAYRNEIASLIEQVGDARITLVPEHIPDDDVHRYFVAADCAVLPYRDTLTSGAAVLAMSLGVPLLAPSKGFLVNLVSPDCGILYPLEQSDGLLQAMNEIRARQYSAMKIIETVKKHRWEDAADATVSALFGATVASQAA